MATEKNLTVHQDEASNITVTLQTDAADVAESKNAKMIIYRPTHIGADIEVTDTTDVDGEVTFSLTTTHTAIAGTFNYEIWNTSDNNLHAFGLLYVIEERADADVTLTVGTNSFINEEDADTYFNGRLNSDVWEDSSSKDRQKALITSTRRINKLNFEGEKTDEDQMLQFPRDDDTVIPSDIEYGTCELALALLDGIDPEIEFENLGLRSFGYANARATYDRPLVPNHILNGIPSLAAWQYIRPYLRDSKTIDLQRVS